MALSLPDSRQIEPLKGRALRGKDLLFLRQWLGLDIADCCYLLGMPAVRWHYYQKRPDRLLDDAGVALLARALLTHPEAHFLPRFPAFAEVEPAFRRALQQSARAPADPATALGLLLGRDRASVARWRRGTGQRQMPPPVRRLLLVLRAVLAGHGVPGFESLIDRAALEADARGFDLDSPEMNTWIRRAPYRPRAAGAARPPGKAARPARRGKGDFLAGIICRVAARAGRGDRSPSRLGRAERPAAKADDGPRLGGPATAAPDFVGRFVLPARQPAQPVAIRRAAG